jgi:predicted cupin superfamily sugar epimerase
MVPQPNLPERLRQFYNLEPLPVEGGLFKQTYLSAESIDSRCLPERYCESHPYGTATLYLLNTDPDCFSAMHHLPTDEVYHFYMGDPVEMLLLYPDGHSQHVVLGQDVFAGQKVQFVAPRGVWQGSHLLDGGNYALIGTTMAPGYVDSDYTGGTREDLTRLYPQEAGLIRRLTRLPD